MRTWLVLVGIVASAALVAMPVRAETVVYEFPALRGDLAQCIWFNNNLNDRSEGTLIHQVELIYNRTTLPPGASVTVTQTGTTANGEQVGEIMLGNTKLCAGIEAIRPSPVPSPAPALP
jgi:hypothetical protein